MSNSRTERSIYNILTGLRYSRICLGDGRWLVALEEGIFPRHTYEAIIIPTMYQYVQVHVHHYYLSRSIFLQQKETTNGEFTALSNLTSIDPAYTRFGHMG
jgi:hypothetical protein